MPTRLLTLLAALFAMTLLVAACGGDDEPDNDASPSPTETATDDASPTPSETATDGATDEPTDGATTPAATDAPTDPAATEEVAGDPTATEPAATDPGADPPADEDPADGGDPPAEEPDDGPEQPGTAFPPVPEGQDDPCMLTEARIQEITGTALTLLGPTGTPEYQICSYGEPSDPFAVDLMLVDLDAASESAGEPVDGELYISDLRGAVMEGTEVQDLDALGDGSAILITDVFGTTAWAHAGNQVFGATSAGLDDDGANAQALLAEILDGAGS